MPYLKKPRPNPEPIDCKIMSAALKLFVEKGYHKVSIHEIQKLSQVSIGSIYRHFGGKEGVAEALYGHVLNEIVELIDDVSNEISSPKLQFEEIVKQLFSFTETHQDIISFFYHEKHVNFLPDHPLKNNEAPFIKVKDIIALAVKKGEIKNVNSWVTTSILFGGAVRMIQLRLDNIIEEPLDTYIDEFIASLWTGLETTKKPSAIDKNSARVTLSKV